MRQLVKITFVAAVAMTVARNDALVQVTVTHRILRLSSVKQDLLAMFASALNVGRLLHYVLL